MGAIIEVTGSTLLKYNKIDKHGQGTQKLIDGEYY